MTKKDFELIAESLRESFNDLKQFDLRDEVVHEAFEHIVNNLALALSVTNPKFDQARFIKACGVEPE